MLRAVHESDGYPVNGPADAGRHPVLDVVASDNAAAALYKRLGWQHLATVEQR